MHDLDKHSILDDNGISSLLTWCQLEIHQVTEYFKKNITKYLEYSWLDTLDCFEKSLKREIDFISTVLSFVDKAVLNKPNQTVILLFDIDETIWIHNSDWEDFFRPSFFYIRNLLKKKYWNQIDFWVLSSRANLDQDIENHKWLWKISWYINPDLLLSSREYSYDLDVWNEKYQSDFTLYPDWYNQKVNALSSIKKMSHQNDTQFILIDDIIEGWKLEDFWEWVSVRDSIFLW